MDSGATEAKHEFVSVRNFLFRITDFLKFCKFVCHFIDH
jgi:hypothetical protein